MAPRFSSTFALATIVFMGVCIPARAETVSECAARAYAEAISASREWQHALRDMVAKVRPDLAPVATLEMEQQLAQIDRRQAQFQYLLHTDVSRIHTGEGLVRFRNFGWTEADGRALRHP